MADNGGGKRINVRQDGGCHVVGGGPSGQVWGVCSIMMA